MVITLFTGVYLFFLFLIYGTELLRWIQFVLLGKIQDIKVHISIRVILGMIFLATVGMWLSLFLPLGWFVNLLFFLGAVFLVLRNRPLRFPAVNVRLIFSQPNLKWLTIFIALVVFIYALINASGRSTNPDTLLYHIQTIRWIETYPAIPGLANLHFRLAFNSSWLLLNALFSFSFLFGQSLHIMLGLLFVISSGYFLDGFHEIISKKSLRGLFRLLLFPLLGYVSKSELSSPGTDVPAILFMWISLELLWNSWDENNKALISVFQIVAIIFSLFAVTVKLSMLPILVIPGLLLFKNLSSRRFWFATVLLALFILLPWLGRYVTLSGYLLYPFPAIDIFSFDWKMPLPRVREIRDEIVAFARMPGKPIEYVLNLSFSEWFKPWLMKLTFFRQVLVLGALFSPLLFGLYSVLKVKVGKELLGLYLFMYFGLIYWLLTAPAFRFSFGYIALVLVLIVLMFLNIKFSVWAKPLGYAVLIICFLYLSYLLGESLKNKNISDRIIFPVEYESPQTVVCFIGDKKLDCSNMYGWCGYNSFPCATILRPGLLLRGEDWRQGFRSTVP